MLRAIIYCTKNLPSYIDPPQPVHSDLWLHASIRKAWERNTAERQWIQDPPFCIAKKQRPLRVSNNHCSTKVQILMLGRKITLFLGSSLKGRFVPLLFRLILRTSIQQWLLLIHPHNFSISRKPTYITRFSVSSYSNL